MATFQTIINDALLEIRKLTAPGQTASPSDTAFVLDRLNQLIEEWNNRAPMIYAVDRYVFSFTAGQADYTLGPAPADWVGPRPIGEGQGRGILQANYIQAGSPNVFFPISLYNYEQFSNLRVRNISAQIPIAFYNNNAYSSGGDTTVSFYGTPTGGQCELWIRHQASTASTAAAIFDMPPGYQKAITLTLAENIVGAYSSIPGVSLTEATQEAARKARAAIAGTNILTKPQSNDAAGLRPRHRSVSTYNWRTGGY